ncbi:putative copper homeostasis (lipo)protein LpqS [Mycolicibacterium grossiae]|uniref:hypothetical protein n=1 Tax=Mycolicibacterium grossiae TaxID=1552759 RepID=UPI001FE9ADFE|nr:hypothetical protein [Mycolicibacterium grossiae]
MRLRDVRRSRWTAALALSIVICVAFMGGSWAHVKDGAPPPHGAHSAAASPYGGSAADTEHPHVFEGCLVGKVIPHAVLPRLTTALVLTALGLAASIGFAAALWRPTAAAAVRGPPRAVANVMAGQAVLTHFCIARR